MPKRPRSRAMNIAFLRPLVSHTKRYGSNSCIRDNQAQTCAAKKPRLQMIDKDTYEIVGDSSDTNTHNDIFSKRHTQSQVISDRNKLDQNCNGDDDIFQFSSQSRSLNACPSHHTRLQSYQTISYKQTPKPVPFVSVNGEQMKRFFELLETPIIKKFMSFDSCLKVTDKYLIAMTFAYFARAKLQSDEYTVLNFFAALYLAHDVEEDEEDYKYEIFPWALGRSWRSQYKTLLDLRENLWKRMKYRAIVSKRCCDEIMAIEPRHSVWQRVRMEHHSGAIRPWLKEKHDDGKLIGPDGTPRQCDWCNPPKLHIDSDHDSLSPENDQILLQMDSSSSSIEVYSTADIKNRSCNTTCGGFNMNELQQTLVCSSTKTNSSGKGRSLASGDITLGWLECSADVSDAYFCVES